MAGIDARAVLDDPTAADSANIAVPPAIVAQTLGQYVRGVTARIRGGDSGMLPVIVGLILITLVFQAISPNHVYLTANNLVNLFQQSAVFMVLAMAEGFVLLLGEIDLSVGYAAGIGGVVAVQLVQPSTTNVFWLLAIIAAIVVCGVIGGVQGSMITRLRVPSLVVTLAGLLALNGVMLILLGLGPFSGIESLTGTSNNLHVLYNLMWGTIDPTVSWIGMLVIVAALGGTLWYRDTQRRRSGLVAPPLSLTAIKIMVMAAVGVVVVAICCINRANVGTIVGVPWVVPIVLSLLALWTVVLQKTRFGRYVYAIGGNPEAARRAGVNVSRIRTWAFVLCSATAGIGGLLYAAYLGGVSNNLNGGQLVLYAVAAAVIGGTSLFGGRGKPVHGVLGGLVIGAIYNGMFLLQLDAAWQFIVTGLVLLTAVTIDSLSRRGSTGGSLVRR